MPGREEFTFYEILEVLPDATSQQIERAYRIARSTYQPGSVATYSLFSDEDNAETLRRVESAYQVLSDTRLRREYDARLRTHGSQPPGRPRGAVAVAPARPPWTLRPPTSFALEPDESLEPEDGVFEGAVLQRIRLARGIELDEVATFTKINEPYLQHLEANRYVDLPPRVYVRGFLREIAKCLKLNPSRVVDSYLRLYDEQIPRV